MASSLSVDVTLPFQPQTADVEEIYEGDLESSALYRMLPENAREYVRESPHLLEYLLIFPVDIYGIPLFLSELKGDLKKMESPNVIYPVGNETFVHILPDPNDVRQYYIPIEPSFLHSVGYLNAAIECKLVDLLDALDYDPVTEKERADLLKKLLKEITYIKTSTDTALIESGEAEVSTSLKDKVMNFLQKDLGDTKKDSVARKFPGVPQTADGKVIVTPAQYTALEYVLIRDKVDMGILKPFLQDSYIEDISCNGVGPIFIEHKIFKGLKSVIEFKKSDELDLFVLKMAERIKSPITYKSPIVDATLLDGSRINIVYGTEISRHGSNFTIRKAMGEPLSILNIIDSGGMDYMCAAYLWLLIEYGMSLFVSGETASGKTTTLNAITAFLPPDNKIVTIEDTPELNIPHKNWVREVAKGKGKGEGEGGEVTMFDLLRAALRQRPNQILVGEIRGVEGSVAFGAMQTGHPVMATFHASTVEKLIQRLTGDPILIPKTFVDSLNLVVIQSAVKRPTGETVRRVLSISELVGYDPESQGFSFVEAFSWEPVTDTFNFNAKGISFLLEYKIATMLGIPERRKADIYLEIDKRAKILEKLHEAGFTRYYDLFNMLTKVRKQGLLKIDIGGD